MSIIPKIGMVICYDYLWGDEEKSGSMEGKKDRPCVIVIASHSKEKNNREVVVCPITHSPPHKGDSAIEIPYKVSQHLNLDHERMWIKTDEVNKFQWNDKMMPYGITPASQGEWIYGTMPYALRKKIGEQLKENYQKRSLDVVNRDKNYQSIKDFIKDENGSQPRKSLKEKQKKLSPQEAEAAAQKEREQNAHIKSKDENER